MNQNKRVVVFTLASTTLLFVLSFICTTFNINFFSFNNVNIISDVVNAPPGKQDQKTPEHIATKKVPDVSSANAVTFDAYTTPRAFLKFNADRTTSALPQLAKQLALLKKKGKGKVRIAWLGDSLIEGDLVTQTFRKHIQQTYGAYGVGFVPVTSITAKFRNTVRSKWTGDWQEESFKDTKFTAPLYLSGHTFFSSNGSFEMKDVTLPDSNKTQILEKALLCGPVQGNVTILVNGQPKQFSAGEKFNRLTLDSSNSHSIAVDVNNATLPVYGVSFEPANGVVVDNFSFRGITGIELAKLDTDMLSQLDKQQYYDLVVLEYGANLMFRPNDKDYTWYQKHIDVVLKKLHRAMPNTQFLIISTADRAFKYGDEWHTAVGIDSLLRSQASLAYDNDMSFYNMYESMGGAGTIVKWAQATPSLANADYVHPNGRGAEILGDMLYEDVMKDVAKQKPDVISAK